MKTFVPWLFAAFLALTVHAQDTAPKSGPEHEKLRVWTGEWKYEGMAHTNPLGKGGPFAGVQTGRMILNGFFAEMRWNDKGDYGDEKGVIGEGVDIYGYDPATKAYTVTSFDREGARAVGSLVVEGNTWKQASTRTGSDGRTHQTRFVMVFSPDGKEFSIKGELLTEDAKWVPLWDLVMKKVRDVR
jgi:hypothetical protein